MQTDPDRPQCERARCWQTASLRHLEVWLCWRHWIELCEDSERAADARMAARETTNPEEPPDESQEVLH